MRLSSFPAQDKPLHVKSILLLLTLVFSLPLISFLPCRADTPVSGTLPADTTWTKTNNNYIVNGSIVVPPGVTLTIEPGVRVKFNGPYFIYVDGTLKAIGTPAENIIFTANIPGQYWGYIHFRDASQDATFDIDGNYTGGCILQRCLVEYAKGVNASTDAAIRTEKASPFINYCTVRYNECRGIYAFGSDLVEGQVKVTNCLVHENSQTSTSQGSGGGIYIDPGHASNTAICSSNIIRDNVSKIDGGGIYARDKTSVYNNVIINNTATNRGGGMYITGDVIGVNNIIADNTAKNGGGIYSSSSQTISYNHITGNTAITSSGIYASSDTVEYNLLINNKGNSADPSDTIGISGTTAHYNNILGKSTTFALRNYGNADCNCENNWWSTTNYSEIDALIFDKLDDPARGLIDYLPPLPEMRQDVPISPPENVRISSGGGRVKLTWSPNPEPDTAGYKIYWGKQPGYPYENSRNVGNVAAYAFLDLPAGTHYFAVTAYDNGYNHANDNPATSVNENQTNGHESWFSSDLKGKKSPPPVPWLHLLLED